MWMVVRIMSNTPSVHIQPFGSTEDGEEIFLYELKNSSGMRLKITNYGGIVTELWVPDRNAEFKDVVLGFDQFEPYIENAPFFGAIIGRVGNRIRNAQFEIDGVTYALSKSDIHIHGGVEGFDKKRWEPKAGIFNGESMLELRLRSEDGDQGYPGNLEVKVTYTLTEANELRIDYEASSDKKTVVNLTNHSYFNLRGEGNGDVLDHVIRIKSDKITEAEEGLFPTGKLLEVDNTPLDLRTPARISDKIDQKNDQLRLGGGFDHNYVLSDGRSELQLVADVYEPSSGRFMEVLTEEPGVQFYCGNALDGTCVGKSGVAYSKRSGFCLETQHHPDSANIPHFPSTILLPGDLYRTTTIYRFGIKDS